MDKFTGTMSTPYRVQYYIDGQEVTYEMYNSRLVINTQIELISILKEVKELLIGLKK